MANAEPGRLDHPAELHRPADPTTPRLDNTPAASETEAVTTPQHMGAADRPPQTPEDEARQLVARLAAAVAAISPRAVPQHAEQMAWMQTLPPAVRRTVVADVTRALASPEPQTQQREVAAALSRGRDLASRFAR